MADRPRQLHLTHGLGTLSHLHTAGIQRSAHVAALSGSRVSTFPTTQGKVARIVARATYHNLGGLHVPLEDMREHLDPVGLGHLLSVFGHPKANGGHERATRVTNAFVVLSQTEYGFKIAE